MASKPSGFGLWKGPLNSAKYIVAPMVDQSELPWRMLSRRYGAELCYTPMLHAAVFVRDANYRKDNLSVCPEDRPLIVQFCGNDAQVILQAAKYAAPYCDAVDINLGCPQMIAKKGHYGAFLQDDWDLLTKIVGLLHQELSVPVTCKIRVFEDIEKSVLYAQMLERAGCQLLTVHGRTREQKGTNMGLASWKHIKAIKDNIKIPVFANGNIQYFVDIERCLKETGVNGIMSAEGNLFNPAIFASQHPPCWRMSEEYLELVHRYPCSMSYIRGHIFKMWYHVLKQPEYQHYREIIGVAKKLKELEDITTEIKGKLLETITEEELSVEVNIRDLPFWRCQPYFRSSPTQNSGSSDASVKRIRNLSDGKDSESLSLVKRHKKRRVEKALNIETTKKDRWITCDACKSNPKGTRCEYNLCKVCCRIKCQTEKLNCQGHKFYMRPKVDGTKNVEKETAAPDAAMLTAKEDSNLDTVKSVTDNR